MKKRNDKDDLLMFLLVFAIGFFSAGFVFAMVCVGLGV